MEVVAIVRPTTPVSTTSPCNPKLPPPEPHDPPSSSASSGAVPEADSLKFKNGHDFERNKTDASKKMIRKFTWVKLDDTQEWNETSQQ